MFTTVAVIHVILCLALMGLVLLQQGKGADAGAVLGGGGDALMAVGGASAAITKITTGLAIGFMVTSVVLVKLYDQSIAAGPQVVDEGALLRGSVMEGEQTAQPPVEQKAVEVKPEQNTEVPVPGSEQQADKQADKAATKEADTSN